MIALWLFCGVAFSVNRAALGSSILSPMKDDSTLRIFKDPTNELEYALKRHNVDPRKIQELKQRRNYGGDSFIRFGRSGGDTGISDVHAVGSENNPQVSRHPRFKSPDIVIRFGRSGFKAIEEEQPFKRARSDLNFIRFGRNVQMLPAEVDLTAICSEMISGEVGIVRNIHPYLLRLFRLCAYLNSIEDDHRVNFDLLAENQADTGRE